MDEVSDYRKILEDSFNACAEYKDMGGADSPPALARLEFLSEYIFKFRTYDSDYSSLFAQKALQVCSAICSDSTYSYVKDPEQHKWYLLMVNMPFFSNKIEWGASIVGAWFKKELEIDMIGVFDESKEIEQRTIIFTDKQFAEFVGSMVGFVCDMSDTGMFD